MKKIYYLKTCDTCRRILKSLPLQEFTLQEIKSNPVTVDQLEEMYSYTKSFEALFNKRAKKYSARGLNNENLTETDFKQLILEEYTFLKRPVILVADHIFVGNAKKTIEELRKYLT